MKPKAINVADNSGTIAEAIGAGNEVPDTDWAEICAKCHDGEVEPKDCEYYGEPCGCNSPIYGEHPTTEKSSAVGDAAKLREVCMQMLELLMPEGYENCDVSIELDEDQVVKWRNRFRNALAEPARNCERFLTWEAAKAAYWREQGDPADWRKLGAWLFAAKEEVRGEGSPRTEQESEVK